MKAIDLLKNLSLSLLVATVIVTPGYANGNKDTVEDLFEVSHTGLHKKNVENLFEAPQPKPSYLEEKAFFEAIAKRSAALNQLIENESVGDLFIGTIPQSEVLATLSIEEDIFNEDELKNFSKQAEKFKLDEYFRKETKRIVDESQERQKLAMQPSNLRLLGDYVYSAGKSTLSYGLSGLDYIVRSAPAAYYMSYVGVGAIEETVAYAGYAIPLRHQDTLLMV
ncbi:MAG: hypothetical protein H0X26_08115 [Alphaproteobacteria bacterium]|nr:hypothetical protein [Alphaproteobacteria bacterium]